MDGGGQRVKQKRRLPFEIGSRIHALLSRFL
jgi:hypothetical protein